MMRRSRPSRRITDLSDLQAGIARAVNHRHNHYLFIRLDDREGARRLLAVLAPLVIGGEHWGSEKPDIVRNVAISAGGLRRLGVRNELVDVFGPGFSEGMLGRAELIGDLGRSAPDRWIDAFAQAEAHMLLWTHAASLELLESEAARWKDEIERCGLSLRHEMRASMHTASREHFGFSDGFGQPAVDGFPRHPGHTGTISGARDTPLAAGEFVYGYADATGVVAPAGETTLGRHGSILVMRQIRQHVGEFRSMVAAAADHLDRDPTWVAAKLMGRWPDGTPLVLAPNASPTPSQPDLAWAEFRYSDDPMGVRCPLGAHARRGNPRDGLANADMTTRHRIIRRAVPYGPVLPDDQPDDGADRGLMFGMINSSVERQFEYVQSQWFNRADTLGRGAERDPIAGGDIAPTDFVIGGTPPEVLVDLSSCIQTLGGEYYLLPGLRSLAELAAG